MANETYKLISSVVVGAGGSATIDFNNIPQSYTDIKLVVCARGTQTFSNAGNYYTIRPNGLNTNLSSRYILSIGTSAATGSFQPYGYMASSDYTANVFGNNEHYIANYTASTNKRFVTESVNENNAQTVYAEVLDSGLWSSSTAITSLSLVPGGGNFAQYSTAYLYGISNVTAIGIAKATGGVITYDNSFVYHTFPWSGTFTPNQSFTAEYIVVAGGGGGGSSNGPGGGGGAGGFRYGSQSVTAQAYTVTVGGGGSGSPTFHAASSAGSNSSFSTFSSTGGGRGSYGVGGATSGGSGGGGAYVGGGNSSGVSGNAGGYSPSEGNSGGNGSGSANAYGGGGGGGASGSGGSGSGSNGGTGGAGTNTYSTWATATGTGVSGFYAGGGGGGTNNGSTGQGGSGGGGTEPSSRNGVANTGGGGAGTSGAAGAGGSGIVIVRYAR